MRIVKNISKFWIIKLVQFYSGISTEPLLAEKAHSNKKNVKLLNCWGGHIIFYYGWKLPHHSTSAQFSSFSTFFWGHEWPTSRSNFVGGLTIFPGHPVSWWCKETQLIFFLSTWRCTLSHMHWFQLVIRLPNPPSTGLPPSFLGDDGCCSVCDASSPWCSVAPLRNGRGCCVARAGWNAPTVAGNCVYTGSLLFLLCFLGNGEKLS